MNTPISAALLAACQWLKRHPGLKAEPAILLEFVSVYVATSKPATEQESRQCGINAVREIAGCVKSPPTHEIEVIEPEDLRD